MIYIVMTDNYSN